MPSHLVYSPGLEISSRWWPLLLPPRHCRRRPGGTPLHDGVLLPEAGRFVISFSWVLLRMLVYACMYVYVHVHVHVYVYVYV